MTIAVDQTSMPQMKPGGRFAVAFGLCAPLILFLLVPNIVTLFTLAFVGQLGNAALAGMGIANVVFAMLLALLYGFDTGTQAIVARATGAGAHDAAGQTLTDAAWGGGLLGAVLAGAIFFEGPQVVALLIPDVAAASAGAALLHGLAPTALLLGITIPFNAYWIGTGAARIPFFVQIALVPVQIALTWVLVLGIAGAPALGVLGAGLAQTLTSVCALVLQLIIARRRRAPFGRAPRLGGIGAIAKIGWPVSTQQSLLQFGLMIAFAIVSQLGVGATATLNVLVSLTMGPIQAATGVGTAAATLVGQALGRGDARDAARWGWQLGIVSAGVFGALGAVAVFAPHLLLGYFLHDAASVTAAVLPAQLLGAALSVDAFVRVMTFALRGAGATKAASGIPFLVQWVLLLPLMWLVGVKLHYGLTGIVAAQVTLSFVEAAVFALVWQRRRWAEVRIATIPFEQARAVEATPQRVVIMGGAGAGKSTLARAVGDALDLPVIHLDRLMYGPNWTRLAPEVVRANAVAALGGARWVADGSYPQLFDLTLARADLVVWIDQPVLKRLWRAWRKTRIHAGNPRADRPDGCDEAWGWHSVWTVLRFGRFTRETESGLRAVTPGHVLRLKGDRAVARFLATLT